MRNLRFFLAAFGALLALPATSRTLIANANGYTLDQTGGLVRFGGLVIGDNGKVERLVARGEPDPVLAAADTRIDAEGQTLFPGLIDAHGHVMDLGRSALSVDLVGTKSVAEALDRVRAFAAANPQAKWILGRGWNQVIWGRGFPTAADLDRAVADRPVWLDRVDGHAAWANSAAMKIARVSAATPDPAGGRIERGPGACPRACSSMVRRRWWHATSRRPPPPRARRC